jgi:hypothetical protein
MDKKLILVVVIAVAVAVWYFFFKGNTPEDQAAAAALANQKIRNTKPAYAPGAKAIDVTKWPTGTWDYPTGVGAWNMVDVLFEGGHPSRLNLPTGGADAWYKANERLVYGWFKGMDVNPNTLDWGGWNYIKDELKAYMASSSAKDFDTITRGSFRTNNFS